MGRYSIRFAALSYQNAFRSFPTAKQYGPGSLDGDDSGIEEWVPKARSVTPWAKAAALMEDEHVSTEPGVSAEAFEPLEYDAVDEVFAAYPHLNGISLDWRPAHAATIKISELEAVAEDLQTEPAGLLDADLAFVDRNGSYIASWPVASDLAHDLPADARRRPCANQ